MRSRFLIVILFFTVSIQLVGQEKGSLIASGRGVASASIGAAVAEFGANLELQYLVLNRLSLAGSYTYSPYEFGNYKFDARYLFRKGKSGGMGVYLGYMFTPLLYDDNGGLTIGLAAQRLFTKRLGMSLDYGYSFSDIKVYNYEMYEIADYGFYFAIGIAYFIIR